jgi:type IV secretion system protein VirD4
MMILLAAASYFSKNYSLNKIKSKQVGDGQHGTARWASRQEIRQSLTPHPVPFRRERAQFFYILVSSD